MRLSEKRTLVTGAASGNGKACCDQARAPFRGRRAASEPGGEAFQALHRNRGQSQRSGEDAAERARAELNIGFHDAGESGWTIGAPRPDQPPPRGAATWRSDGTTV